RESKIVLEDMERQQAALHPAGVLIEDEEPSSLEYSEPVDDDALLDDEESDADLDEAEGEADLAGVGAPGSMARRRKKVPSAISGKKFRRRELVNIDGLRPSLAGRMEPGE
ncbi:MAG: hypothetical protein EB140_14290, partial [Proteobacteria bacterium]|nr:hypothetical protein [Pseudomonadota bacterium]